MGAIYVILSYLETTFLKGKKKTGNFNFNDLFYPIYVKYFHLSK